MVELDIFFENLADILANLPQNPWAIVALVVLVIGVLAFLFFDKSKDWVKLLAFSLCLVGAAGIIYVVANHDVAEASSAVATKPSTSGITGTTSEPIDGQTRTEEPVEVDCNELEQIDFETWMDRCNKN
ncbi:MAG: hypothetical protein AAFZ99_15435 [Pseudomonadota bacterium]